jgi:CBS domain-containing protein
VVALRAGDELSATRAWLARHAPGSGHQGFPLLDDAGHLVGVLTRRDLLDPARGDELLLRELITRRPVVVHPENTLREAADHMVHEGVGRLPVVASDAPKVVVGILSRSDLLGAHARRLGEAHEREQHLDLAALVTGRRNHGGAARDEE